MQSGPGLASGWYWTARTLSLSLFMPSTVPSLALSWVISRSVPSTESGTHGKVVILRGDVDDLLFQVFDGLIAAMVAELELEGLGTQGQGYDLMSQAYSEDGNLSGKVLDGRDGLLGPLGIARPIGDEEGLWPCRLDLERCRHEREARLCRIREHERLFKMFLLMPRSSTAMRGPWPFDVVGCFAGHIPQQILRGDIGLGPCHCHHIQVLHVSPFANGKRGPHHAMLSHLQSEHASIHAAQSRLALIHQELIERFCMSDDVLAGPSIPG